MPKKYKVYRDFSGGLNSKTNPKDIEDNELVEASGVLVDQKGLIRTNQPSGAGGASPKIAGITDHSATIKAGRGLFSFKSDYSWGAAADTIEARESEYICIGDKASGEVDLYGYDDDSNDHELNTGVIDLGSNTTTQFEFYYADGALRVCDAAFSTNSTTKWFGRIGPDKKLLGEGSVTEQWISLSNTLTPPVVGFVSPSLSGTADAALSSTTILGHPASAASTGSITAWATSSGSAQATSSSHNLSAGDSIVIASSNLYDGIHTISSVPDGNNFVLTSVPFLDNTASGTWLKTEAGDNFQGWDEQHDASGTNPVTTAASASRWLIAYDTDNNDVFKITAVTTADQKFTTDTNSANWDNRAFELYPYPGDGILLEAYQSESSTEGAWQEGEYEFGQSFIYEGNQESKIEKLNGNNISIDALQVLYAKVHVSGVNTDADNISVGISQRLIGGRVYTRKAGTNNFWSLLIDMDFRVGGSGGGGGTRLATVDNYDLWTEGGAVRDADSGGSSSMGFTNTNFRGFRSKQYTIKRMSIESYENINGFSPNENALSFGDAAAYAYKSSVVAGQRVFVANVYYVDSDDPVARIMGDAIFYTPVGKYDTFPSSYKLEIAGNDGDQFTALAYTNGVLFAFKKNSLYRIDVSSPNEGGWKLLDIHSGMGVMGGHSVTNTSLGISWVSKSGVYIFIDNKPVNLLGEKISKSDWDSFFNTTYGSMIGWDSRSNKLLLIDTPLAATSSMMYDLETQTWTSGYPLTTNPKWEIPAGSNTNLSNMVNFTGNEIEDSSNGIILGAGGILLYGDEDTTGANDCDLYKMTFTSTTNSAFIVTTKDDDFGLPNVYKKIYEIQLEYVTDNTSDAIDVRYEIDGNDVPHASSTALATNSTLSGVANKDNVNLITYSPTHKIKCRSISLRISSTGTTECYLDIVSIGIRYRPLTITKVVTETD